MEISLKNRITFFLKLGIFLIFLCSYNIVYSQEKIIRQYGVSDGFPSNNVYSGIQSKDGYMWFCTDKGVVRFDGFKSEVFNTSKGLLHDDIWDLTEDSKGRIWVSTYGPKVQYIFEGEVYSIEVEGDVRMIQKIIEDEFGGIWIVSDFESYFFDGKDKFRPFMEEPHYGDRKGDTSFNTLQDERNGDVYFIKKITLNNQPIWVGKFKVTALGEVTLERAFKSDLRKYDEYFILNHKLLGLRNEKLEALEDFTDRSLLKQLEPIKIRLVNHYSEYTVIERTGGVVLLNSDWSINNILERYKDYNINVVFVDGSDNLWIATKDEGVLLINDSQKVISYKEIFGDKPGLSKLKLDEENRIWIGGGKNAIHYIENDEINTIKLFKEEVLGNQLRDLEFFKNTIFFGFNVGFRYVDLDLLLNSRKPVKLNAFIKNSTVKDLDKNKEGVLFTLGNVVRSLKNNGNANISGLSYVSSKIGVLNKDILAGGYKGLYILYKDSIRQMDQLRKSISHIEVVPSQKFVWIATTDNKLYYLNDEYTIIDSFQINEELISVFPENDHLLWLATNNGVVGLDVNEKGEQRWITVYDGLQSNEILDVISTEGKLYACSKNGLDVLSLEKIETNDSLLRSTPHFLEIRLNGDKLETKATYALNYDENNIQIYFPSLDFSYSPHMEYHYRMLPNQTWNILERPEVSFASLAPDDYKFEFKYVIPNRSVSEVKSIAISIQAHVVQQRWFVVCSLILLGLGVGFFIDYRLKVNRKKSEARQLLEKKFSDLELQALQAQMNPHFIFNALGTIQHFIAMEQSEKAENYLTEFASLLRAYLEASREKFIPLEEELSLLKYYVSLEQMRAEGAFSFEIEIEEGLQLETCMVPSFLIQPFIENAILHGLIPREGKGHLLLEITRLGLDKIKVKVEDDGVGRAVAQKRESDKIYTSRGLKIVEERIAAINRIKEQSICFSITDKPNQAGTIVELILPLEEDE